MQHHMLREAGLVAPVLDLQGPGHFYVCGDAKNMAKVGCFAEALQCCKQQVCCMLRELH